MQGANANLHLSVDAIDASSDGESSDKYSPENYPDPKPCGLGKDDIFKLAQKIAQNYNPENKFSTFLQNYGGKLIEETDDIPKRFRYARSCIIIEGKGNFEIRTRELTERKRMLFDLAHEFGHYYLHYLRLLEQGESISQKMAAGRCAPNGEEEEQVEFEANIFAICFLLPEERFVTKRKDFDNDKQLLANYFGVSRSTIDSFASYLRKRDDQNAK